MMIIVMMISFYIFARHVSHFPPKLMLCHTLPKAHLLILYDYDFF